MSSQYSQDHFVLSVLNGQRGGYFLDSGASDGVSGNNTLMLEREFGWDGICIEPNFEYFSALRHNRSCACVNCCVYDDDGEVEFLEAGPLGGIVEAYHPSILRHAQGLYASAPVVVRRTRDIRSLLIEFDAPTVIDYWSLDTEGSELSILRSFPFSEFHLRVLTVEHNWLPARAEIYQFLLSRGFVFVRELGCDDGYVHVSVAQQVPAWRSAVWSSRHHNSRQVVGHRPTRC